MPGALAIPSHSHASRRPLRAGARLAAILAIPAVLLIVGCGGGVAASGGLAESLRIAADSRSLTTGGHVQLRATLSGGEATTVHWQVVGGDPVSGAGTLSPTGLYTPPAWLTQDRVTVTVTALAGSDAAEPATMTLTVTPGFLQPLTPGNLALAPGASATLTGSLALVGGSAEIHFALAQDPAGTPSALGALSPTHCQRNPVSSPEAAYTVCSTTYTAPASATAGTAYVIASVEDGGGESRAEQQAQSQTRTLAQTRTRILLSPLGMTSNPVTHQAHLPGPTPLGVSTGNNLDYDSAHGLLSDCCGGTLGALVEDAGGQQFVLSNNHVLARSDRAVAGETIVQPGLIDNACTPLGYPVGGPGAGLAGGSGIGSGIAAIASLAPYPALAAATTNVDAALARVAPGAVDARGETLELGARQPDGTLAAAAPGTSSTGGRGEPPMLGMVVAKSGRTTGLTCAPVTAVNVDVEIDYYNDCAETSRALTKTFTNQFVIAGASFSDAGDSGALVVDTTNAEPVGLFFAGATDANGLEQAIASPIGEVLRELGMAAGPAAGGAVGGSAGGASPLHIVGGADHAVACLSYPAPPTAAPPLAVAELVRARAALPLAQQQFPAQMAAQAAAQMVSITASRDQPGRAALLFHLEPGAELHLPAVVSGLPTAVANSDTNSGPEAVARTTVDAASFRAALAARQRWSARLMRSESAIFGVGVGASLDNPAEAAVVVFVDRGQSLPDLPTTLDGVRVRVVAMDRPHVTRAHAQPVANGCPGHGPAGRGSDTLPAPFGPLR